jgi:GNAT superfamily N-acetyltransferase
MLADFRAQEGLPRTALTPERVQQDVFAVRRRVAIHVARSGTALLGFITFKSFYDPGSGVDGMHLCDLYVRDDQRRRGIGLDLFHSCKAVSLRTGKAFVWWVTRLDNDPMLSLASRVGAAHAPVHSVVLLAPGFERPGRAAVLSRQVPLPQTGHREK